MRRPPEWTFLDLLKRGLVEYVDVNEENDCLVSLFYVQSAAWTAVALQPGLLHSNLFCRQAADRLPLACSLLNHTTVQSGHSL